MTVHTPAECVAAAEGLTVLSEVTSECPTCRYSIIPGHRITLHTGRWHHHRCVAGEDTTSNAQHPTEA